MPGNIHVSVLDFKDLPSSLPPSSILIKISMGKRKYQTWDKGDFSFPLTTLRDNVTVALQDTEGNEISNTGVQTMSVVEKGSWDEFLPVGEGGHVHMRLQFVLSEEERNRVRSMRESAMKKKCGELLNTSLRCSETATTASGTVTSSLGINHEVSDSQRSVKHNEVVSIGDPPIHADTLRNPEHAAGNEEGTAFHQREIKPNDADGSEETSSAASISKRMDVHLGGVNQSKSVEKTESKLRRIDFPKRPLLLQEALSSTKKNLVDSELKNDQADQLERQDPLEKTPHNVRKMISAFESSLSKDMRSGIKPPRIGKSQYEKVGWETPMDLNSEEITEQAKQTSGRLNSHFLTGETQQIQTYGLKREKHIVFDKDSRKSSWDSRQLEEPNAIQLQSKETESIAKHEWKPREDLVRMTTVEAATIKHIVFDKDSRKSSWDSGKLEEPSATQFQSKETESIAKHEWKPHEDLVRMIAVEAATKKHIVFDKDLRKSSRDFGQLEGPSATQCQSKETELIAKHGWKPQEDLVRMTAAKAPITKHIEFDKDSKKLSRDSGQVEDPSATQYQSKETESIEKHEWNSQEDSVRMTLVEAATEKHIVFDKDSRKSSWDSGQLVEPSATQFQSKGTETIAKHEWNSQEDSERMTAVEVATAKHVVFDKDSRKSSWHSGQLEEPSATQFQSEETESIAKHEWNSQEDLVRMTDVEATTAKHVVFDKDSRKSSWDSEQFEEPSVAQFQSKETESIANPEWKSQEDLVRMNVVEAATAMHIVFAKDFRKSSLHSGKLEESSATQFQSKETELIAKRGWNSQEDLERMTAVEAATTKDVVLDKDSRKSSWDSGQLEEPSTTQFQSKETESTAKHKWISLEDLMRKTAIEVATVSGNTHEEHSGLNQPRILLVNQEDSSGTTIMEGCGSGIRSSNSHEVNTQGLSEDKLKPAALCENEHSSSESSGAWIFQDHARSLCVTTGRKQVMELVEGCGIQERTHEGKKSFSLPSNVEKPTMKFENYTKEKKGDKTPHELRKLRRESSAEVETSNGPLGQVIKVAIMVAFGALVLLTRQRKPR